MSDEPLIDPAEIPQRLGPDVSRRLIIEVASGLEDGDAVARRLGVDESLWQRLKAWPPFVREIEQAKKELYDSGLTFRNSAKLKAEILADRIFQRAMTPEATPVQMLSALEYFTSVGDLKPKANAAAVQGAGFSIQIVLGQPQQQSKPAEIDLGTIDVTSELAKPDELPTFSVSTDGTT